MEELHMEALFSVLCFLLILLMFCALVREKVTGEDRGRTRYSLTRRSLKTRNRKTCMFR